MIRNPRHLFHLLGTAPLVLMVLSAPAAFGQLISEGNQIWEQGRDGILDNFEGGDAFGSELAVGDFNGDGFKDLAVGVPGENNAAGRVNVIYGGADGLSALGNQRWSQEQDGILDDEEGGDLFGLALAAGDFNGDGHDDLAVGAPGENSGRGRINVIYGSPDGLTSAGNQRWNQGDDGILDDDEDGDGFGSDLASGDFNGDGYCDLAIGVPGEDSSNHGRVNVIYGSAGVGLTSSGNQIWTQGRDGILDDPEPGDAFGTAVAAGDFNGDGFDDLVAAAPGENDARGRINVIYGGAGAGLRSQGNQIWSQGRDGILDDFETGDLFGNALAVGDFNGDGYHDLAVGVPGENSAKGRVNIIYGGPGAGLSANGNQRWTQGADGILDDDEDGDIFGFSLAAGDFNFDGYDDLAVGVPNENNARGRVNVIYGGPGAGLRSEGNQRWDQEGDIQSNDEDGDSFGRALAAGDFGHDGAADMAVGTPGEDGSAGAVNVIYGSSSGANLGIGTGGVVGAGLSIPLVTRAAGNMFVAIFGTGFADPGQILFAIPSGGKLPEELGGICVEFGGMRAAINVILENQINAIVPPVSSTGRVPVVVIENCGLVGERRSRPEFVEMQPAAPEFFFLVTNADGVNPIAAIDVTQNFGLVGPDGSLPGAAPARPGDILSIFMNGLGPTDPPARLGELVTGISSLLAPVRARFGEVPANVLFAGLAPGFAGLYQINLEVPANSPTGNVPLTITVGQAVSTPPGGFIAVAQ